MSMFNMIALYCIFSVTTFKLSIGLNNKISLLKKIENKICITSWTPVFVRVVCIKNV